MNYVQHEEEDEAHWVVGLIGDTASLKFSILT